MRRGRCESRSDDHGREALALMDSLKGHFRLFGQAVEGHGYSDDRSGSENLTEVVLEGTAGSLGFDRRNVASPGAPRNVRGGAAGGSQGDIEPHPWRLGSAGFARGLSRCGRFNHSRYRGASWWTASSSAIVVKAASAVQSVEPANNEEASR